MFFSCGFNPEKLLLLPELSVAASGVFYSALPCPFKIIVDSVDQKIEIYPAQGPFETCNGNMYAIGKRIAMHD